MINLLNKLEGKKTYIIAVTAGVVFTLQILGVIDQEMTNQILTFLGIGGLATLRSSIK